MTDGVVPSIELSAGDAAVLFTKSQDRYEHRLVVRCGQSRVSLMQSILRDASASWPTDPAIQQLVLEPIGCAKFPQVALGVGMSGKGHWSLASQWLEGSNPLESVIEFDYACKQQPPVEFLGSTYQIADLSGVLSLNRVDSKDRCWTGWFEDVGAGVEFKLSVEVLQGQLEWKADTRQLQITPHGSFEKPSTLRWCYRIAWLSCHE